MNPTSAKAVAGAKAKIFIEYLQILLFKSSNLNGFVYKFGSASTFINNQFSKAIGIITLGF
ncbi:hypothetical protein CEP83_02190 [Moraxella catarrhalis]|nr:hypothetical protein CEP83_02190 [Moraxella catarrhalis]